MQLTRTMLAPFLLVFGVAAVFSYDLNDGNFFPDAVHFRSERSIRREMSNSGAANQMAMFHRMNNVRASRNWRPPMFHGNNRMQRIHNRPYWIPLAYTLPFYIPSMHAFTRASPHVRPFQPTNMPSGRFPAYMFPLGTNQRFPISHTRWQSRHSPRHPMMHWNLQNMQRFPMMPRPAFGHGLTGSAGIQSSTEASAGKGSKGVTPFDDRK